MRSVRTWLVWLVVAVMPLQGLAAAVMSMTEGSAHAGPAAHAVAMDGHAHHHGSGASAGADHTGHHGVHATPATACDGCGDDTAAHDPLKCCGAACTMALAMTTGLPAGSHARPPAPQPAPAGLHPGVVPDGLDRPPRTS